MIAYDFHNDELSDPISVMAVDEETILIVSCHSAPIMTEHSFASEINAFYTKSSGMRKEALKQYPGRKTKFIWATHNYISNRYDLALLKKFGFSSAYIIDGQHRLYGYSDSRYSTINTIPVVAFIDLERSEQIKLFMDINENQKAVPKSLRVTLNADMLWESSDFSEQRQALRSKIAQMLGEESTSPLHSRVVIGENESTFIRCITVEAIQSALKKCRFFDTYGKRNVLQKEGTFDCKDNQETWVFIQDNGDIMFPTSPTQMFDKFLKRKGLPPRKFHALRHTSATLSLISGVDIKTVGERLGHSQMKTTNRYVHALEEADERAADVLGELVRELENRSADGKRKDV